jgi:CHAT domain-containing protein
MAHSYAQHIQVTCPECEQHFEAEVWLIVDTQERPDLLQRIQDGSLHQVTCPHCGKELGQGDAPLLLFRPDQEPAILFSPAQGTSQEQDREQAAGLLSRLHDSLGDAWQDEWLSQGLHSVARPMLAAALSDDPQAYARLEEQAQHALEHAPLLQTLDQFIRASTWTESRHFLIQHPELLQDEAAELLAHLVRAAEAKDDQDILRVLQEHQALLARCREIGVDQAFAEKINIPPAALQAATAGGGLNVPAEFRADLQQAQEGERRYRATGDRVALDAAAAAWERVLGHPAFVNADQAFRLAVMNDAGGVFLRRYWAQGRIEDLNRALTLWQDAVDATPPNSPDRAGYLNNQSISLIDFYKFSGRPDDLEDAIQASTNAVDATPPDSPDRPGYLNNLANGLSDRYAHSRNLNDLVQAIQAYTDAVAATPQDSPDRPRYLNNLGTGMRTLYALSSRNLDILDQAIQSYEAACQLGLTSALEASLDSSRNWGHWACQRQSWSEAVRAYAYGLDAAERLYQAQVLTARRQTWQREVGDLHARAAYALARDNQPQQAVVTLERGRARSLGDTLARDRADLEMVVQEAPPIYHRFANAAQELRRLEAAERAGASAQQGSPTPQELHQAMEGARRELNAAVQEIRTVPGFEHFMEQPEFEDVAAPVLPNQPLAYLAVTPWGALALLLHGQADVRVVWADSFTLQQMDDLLVQREQDQITGGYLPGQFAGGKSLQESLAQVLPILGEQLMAPLADILRSTGASTVTLVPCGRLGLLPLHAARYTVDGGEVHFLDEFDVSYAPSARSLAAAQQALQQRQPATPTLTGVGNPLSDLPSLEFAHAELEEIAKLFVNNSQHPLYEAQATRSALLERLPTASHIHLACHGTFNPDNALDSALALSGEDRLTLRDVLDEIPDALADARMVALSACQSGITEFRSLPDEYVGLPAGFVQAGVPGVVGTLWPVNDLSTALIMIKFYEYHLQGNAQTGEGPMPPARALCQAQRWLRQVTAGELRAYFEHHQAVLKAEKALRQQDRMPIQVANVGKLRFMLKKPNSRPFEDSPYHWAPFIFLGV